VLDFVGICENLEKALVFDSDDVSGVIQNLDVLKERFERLMDNEVAQYLALAEPPLDDKAVERIIETFVDKDARETFAKLFNEVETLYEIISPDPVLRDYIESYQQLASIYQIMRSAFRVKETPVRDLMRKTEELVREHVETGLEDVLPIDQINEETLEALQKDG
jgi:type I restriction enzyme R subunit